jgi:phosphoribosylanthranilate isomerase
MVAAAGADFVGVILSPGFGRTVPLGRAGVILAEAGGCRRVGVFVDAGTEEMLRAADLQRLDVVQLHRAEPPERPAEEARGGVAVWKAVRPRAAGDVRRAVEAWTGRVEGLLLDGYDARAPGGAGARFDWRGAAGEWPAAAGPRRIVAGGLSRDNVAEAIALLAPDVVDVSSGVERAHGRKDAALVAGLLAAVAAAPAGAA